MNFQEKLLESSAELRTRARAIAASAAKTVRDPAKLLSALDGARRKLGRVARRHGTRFVKQNASIASDLRKDVTELARTTYATLSTRPAPKKPRRAAATRKRSTSAA